MGVDIKRGRDGEKTLNEDGGSRVNIMTELTAYARSASVLNPKLQMFSLPKSDLSISARREVRINPQTTGLNPISFQIEPSRDFINLDATFFEVELAIKKNDGNNLAAADRVVLANNLAHTLFRQISVRLNGTLLSPQTDTYHLLAMIETMLHNDRQDGEDILVPQGWYNCLNVPDAGEADVLTANQLDPTHADHTALPEDMKQIVLSRVKFLGGNRILMRFTPTLEIFRLGRLLKPNVQIQIEMYLNSPNLWTARQHGAVALRLTEQDINVRLFIEQTRVEASVYTSLMRELNSGKRCIYPTVRGAIRTYAQPATNRHFECDNPFHGQVPNRIVVALMKQTAFNGSADTNPFTFGKFNLSTIKLLISGEEYPYETLELNHDNDHKDLRGYHRFLAATGCLTRGHGNMVKPGDWGDDKRANLFVFDTTANGSLDSPILNPKQAGEPRLVLDFGANPGAALTIVVYGEFENVLEITGQGTVTYDVHQ